MDNPSGRGKPEDYHYFNEKYPYGNLKDAAYQRRPAGAGFSGFTWPIA
jgi:hypothetical protein